MFLKRRSIQNAQFLFLPGNELTCARILFSKGKALLIFCHPIMLCIEPGKY